MTKLLSKLENMSMDELLRKVSLHEITSDVKLMSNDRFYTRLLNSCFTDFCSARFAIEVRAFMETQLMQQIQYSRAVALKHFKREAYIEHFIPEMTLSSWGKLYADTEYSLHYADERNVAFTLQTNDESKVRILLGQELVTRHMDGSLLTLEKYSYKKGSARDLCQLSVFSGFEHQLTWDGCAREYEMNIGYYRNEAFPCRPHVTEWRTPTNTITREQIQKLDLMEDSLIHEWETMMVKDYRL